MKMKGDRFEALMQDLEAATTEIVALARRHPESWERGLPGKWTVAQHADHVAVGLAFTAETLEANERLLKVGKLPRRPWRGPLQSLFVAIVVGAGRLPRGGRAPRRMRPAPHPDHDEVLARIVRDAARHRTLGLSLSAAGRDRLWIPNPYRKQWHYSFSESLRMNAVHFRHHARQMEEIVAATASDRNASPRAG
jgi:hypothetical protein